MSYDRTKTKGHGEHWGHKFVPSEIKAVLNDEPTPEQLQMSVQQFLEEKRKPRVYREDETLTEMQAKLEAAQNTEIKINHDPDYYPTPRDVIERMIDELDIRQGSHVLEPSAGDGRIADTVESKCEIDRVDCCEVNYTARQVLEEKGHNLVGFDFMEYDPGPVYDYIVANPPFSKMQDAHHFLHAWDCLVRGGKMAFIMSGGTFGSSLNVRKEVEEIVDEFGWYEELPRDTFKEVGTNVSSYLVIVEKS